MDIPIYSEKTIAPRWQLNALDLKKILKVTIVFFAAPIIMYLGQLQGILSSNGVVLVKDLAPSIATIAAIETWIIGIAINFFIKLNDGPK